jgi:hypothetical protein
VNDVHTKIEGLEGTVDAAQSALGKVERVLTVADEAHDRSHRFAARLGLLLALGAAVVVGLAVLRRRSP